MLSVGVASGEANNAFGVVMIMSGHHLVVTLGTKGQRVRMGGCVCQCGIIVASSRCFRVLGITDENVFLSKGIPGKPVIFYLPGSEVFQVMCSAIVTSDIHPEVGKMSSRSIEAYVINCCVFSLYRHYFKYAKP